MGILLGQTTRWINKIVESRMERTWHHSQFAIHKVSVYHRIKVVLFQLLSIPNGAADMMDLDIMHVLSVIHYKTCVTVSFQLTHFPCDDWENIYTFSYYHHRIGSMNYYPLFGVRSWNNDVRRMSFCILICSNGFSPSKWRAVTINLFGRTCLWNWYIYERRASWFSAPKLPSFYWSFYEDIHEINASGHVHVQHEGPVCSWRQSRSICM